MNTITEGKINIEVHRKKEQEEMLKLFEKVQDEKLLTLSDLGIKKETDTRKQMLANIGLEEIDSAIKLNIFDDIQIWTTEDFKKEKRRQDDPLVLGMIDMRYFFMITRWGESLKNIDQIREINKENLRIFLKYS